MDEEFKTVKELAKIFRVTPLTVYKWIEKGKIKYIQVDKSIRIPMSQFFEEKENEQKQRENSSH